MAVTIRCSGCQAEYRVDDSLVGKRVKCRGCGQPIVVTRTVPTSQNWGDGPIAMESTASAAEETEVSSALLQAAAEPSGAKCPKCGAKVAGESSICFGCGYNFRTRTGGTPREIPLMATAEEEYKKRPRRTGGSEILHSIDKYLGLAVVLMVLAGVGVWLMHVIKVAGTFSTGLVLPVAIVAGLLAAVMAPLMLLGIQIGCHLMRWKPREDTYKRLMVVLFLPFGAALLCGGHEAENPLFAVGTGGWMAVVTIGAFVYLFRAEMQEWVGTVISGLVGGAVGWFAAACIVAPLVTVVTGAMYVEALPPGPWGSIATAHMEKKSSENPAVAKTAETTTTAVPAAVSSEPLPPPPPGDAGSTVATPVAPEPAPVTPAPPLAVAPVPAANVSTPAAAQGPSDLFPGSTGAQRKPPTAVATGTPMEPSTGVLTPPEERIKPPAAGPIKSPLVAEMTTGTFEGAKSLIVSQIPSPWVLAVKRGEEETVLQRWNMDPPTAKGEMSVVEPARDSNCYMLSPRGDILLVLMRLPKWELDIKLFDSNITTKKIPLTDDLQESQKSAVPTLVGFLSPTRFLMRWDFNGQILFHVRNTMGGVEKKFDHVEPYESGPNGLAISPDGRYVAVMNKAAGASKRVVVYDTTTGISKQLNPTSDKFENQGMAFSPDSKRLAVFVQTTGADMVITFGMDKGDMLTPAFLHGGTPIDPNAAPRGFLWLRGSPVWVVDGTQLFDSEQGKRVGPLQVGSVVGTHVIGPSSLLVMQSSPEGDSGRYTVLKMDDTAVQNAIAMTRKK